MILIVHILIALSSLIATAYAFVFPSQTKLNLSYVLIVLTVVSGTILVFSNPANMTRTCVTGLIYLAIMFVGIGAARHRLAQAKITI